MTRSKNLESKMLLLMHFYNISFLDRKFYFFKQVDIFIHTNEWFLQNVCYFKVDLEIMFRSTRILQNVNSKL